MVAYEHLVAGVSGGFVSTLVVHPLDLLKVRYAVNDGNKAVRPQYTSYASLAREVIQSRGLRGLYQGITPNLVGNASAWGLYFCFFNALKDNMKNDSEESLGPFKHLTNGIIAGCLTLTLTNPIWVAKTRLCLQYEGKEMKFHGLTDTLAKTYSQSGIRGLYKGFIPGVIGTSHGAVQFMLYEEMKQAWCKKTQTPLSAQLEVKEYLTIAGLSKMFATVITYPYQVLRARLQDQHVQYEGVMDVVRKTYRNEGIVGFYKGLLPSILRVTPATAMTFVVYEEVRHRIQLYKK